MSAIQALVFDFDGLILDTEEPIFRAWQSVYQEYGVQLDLAEWEHTIGSADVDWQPMTALEQKLGRSVDHQLVEQRQLRLQTELIERLDPLPGVLEYLQAAHRLGIKVGLASSSSFSWVVGHLDRLGLTRYFETIRTSNDVQRTKPDPELYLSALDGLDVLPSQAVAFEDSLNGVCSAKRAGMYCVAVPSALTHHMDLTQADVRLESLATEPLSSLLDRILMRE